MNKYRNMSCTSKKNVSPSQDKSGLHPESSGFASESTSSSNVSFLKLLLPQKRETPVPYYKTFLKDTHKNPNHVLRCSKMGMKPVLFKPSQKELKGEENQMLLGRRFDALVGRWAVREAQHVLLSVVRRIVAARRITKISLRALNYAFVVIEKQGNVRMRGRKLCAFGSKLARKWKHLLVSNLVEIADRRNKATVAIAALAETLELATKRRGFSEVKLRAARNSVAGLARNKEKAMLRLAVDKWVEAGLSHALSKLVRKAGKRVILEHMARFVAAANYEERRFVLTFGKHSNEEPPTEFSFVRVPLWILKQLPEYHRLFPEAHDSCAPAAVLSSFPRMTTERAYSAFEFLSEYVRSLEERAKTTGQREATRLMRVETEEVLVCQECGWTRGLTAYTRHLQLKPIPAFTTADAITVYDNQDFSSEVLSSLALPLSATQHAPYLAALQSCFSQLKTLLAQPFSSPHCVSLECSLQFQGRVVRDCSGLVCSQCARETLHLRQTLIAAVPQYLLFTITGEEWEQFEVPEVLHVRCASERHFALRFVVRRTQPMEARGYAGYSRSDGVWLRENGSQAEEQEVLADVHFVIYSAII